MKKTLILSALDLTALAPTAMAKSVTLPTGKYPVPVERRVPWTIISGSDASAAEGAGIANLIDRNPLTYWHTGYNNGVNCNANDPDHQHWFMIDRGIGADKVPFDMLSIQQRVVANGKWNGAVTDADIYVTDEYIGLQGGYDNQAADNAAIAYFTQINTPTTSIHLDYHTDEAELFDFDSAEPQTGRFILVVIQHTTNPGQTTNPDDTYACLSEFNLFAPDSYVGYVEAENFSGDYAIATANPENSARNNKRTVSLTFSDDTTPDVRYSPMLQSDSEPYITYLNWLDWKKTYFDITPLMTVSVADQHKIQINATGAGSGMFKALFVDFNSDEEGEAGFKVNDLVLATSEAGDIAGLFEAELDVNVDDYSKIFRARYIVDSEQITSPEPRDGIGAAGGIVVDFMITMEQPVNFNVVYTFNGAEVGRLNNQNAFANVPFSLTTPDFFDIDATFVAPDPDAEEYAGKEQPFDVEVALSRVVLPFNYTTLSEDQSVADVWGNLVWQAISQHTSYSNSYVWTIDPNDAATMVGSKPANSATNGFADNQLWAFVGDFANGFKIYNKELGQDKCVYKDGNSVKIGDPGANECIWFPYKSSANGNTKTHCALKSTTSSYVNLNSGDPTHLTFYGQADAGSTIWFTSATSFATPIAKAIIFAHDSEYGKCIGISAYDDTTNKDLYDAAIEIIANPLVGIGSAAKLSEIINGDDGVKFDENAWYRFVNYSYRNNYFYGQDKIFGNTITPKDNYNSIAKFVPIEGSDRFYISCQGKYLSQCRQSAQLSEIESEATNKGEFKLYTMTPGVFAIKDETGTGNRIYLHQDASHKVVGWETSATATRWYISMAEDVDVNLNITSIPGLAHAAVAYFPFPVKSNDSGTKLYTIEPATHNETGADVVTYVPVTSVPAETAFIVANEELPTVTLLIDYQPIAVMADGDETAVPAKFAEGALRSKTAEAGDFILNNEGDALSFKKSTDAPSIADNYIYLPAKNVTSTAEELPFANPQDATTSIDVINVENSTATTKVYDLQGRRIAAPAKGINIINGKKVLVK